LAALRKFYELARNDGERRLPAFTQAIVYVHCGKMELALEESEKEYAIAEKTNDVGSMSGDVAMKANILLDMGKHQEALAAFERSAHLITTLNLSQEIKDNTKLFQHYNNARVAIARKDLKTAKAEAEEFRKRTEANGNSNQIRVAHELAGTIALAENKSDAAIAKLLQSNQQDPYDLYRTALAYQMKGGKAQAKEFCKKAAHFNGLPQMNYAFVRSKAEKMFAAM
jgi:tetratricopeptide (TPR) repeat protein